MSRFAKNVKRAGAVKGKKMDSHELDSHLHKIKNKLGGSDNVDIDGDKVVGNFGYVEVKPTGYVVHKEGTKFGKTFQFNELGKLHDYVRDMDEDYMDDRYMMAQPAPARPQTRPDTPVKPAKPDTDKPSPSKRPFTPPPHITPGEEPAPKARFKDEYYGNEEAMDYMSNDVMYLFGAVLMRWIARRRGEELTDVALGFGDVNLSGVLGLFLGWPAILVGLFISVLIGGVFSLLYLIVMVAMRRYRLYSALPYGPFLVAGAVLILFFRDYLIQFFSGL